MFRIRSRTYPALRWLAAVLLAATLGPACKISDRDADPAATEIVAEAATIATTSATVPAATDDGLASGRRIAFAPCDADPELECGQLSVPLDHAHPRGDQIALATVRAPALTAHKRGVLFVNPGGPGGSGVDFVILAKSLFEPLRRSFDIVSFDPRGTARSRAVDCTIELPPPPVAATDEALAAYLDEIGARYAAACRDQHGALATRVGTDDVARDIDAFRAALGERELSYLGFSYGTILGTAYATLFPNQVRAMVLDGDVTPAWFNDYLLELDADGSAGAELALRRLDQLCSANAACPLHAAGVVATYDRVVERLDRNPVIVDSNAISGASVTNAVFPLLYQEARGWPMIANLLASADAGNYAGLPAFPLDAGATLVVPSTFAIVCDDAASRRLGADYVPSQRGTLALYPRFGGVNFGSALTLCSQWPRTRTAPLAPLATRHPIVLIGNDFDPATPMTWARNLAAALGPKATLVRYQGGGHTIYGSLFGGGSACINDAVETYLRDPTATPSELICPAQSLSFRLAPRAAAPTMAEILQRVAPAPPPVLRRR